MFLNRKKTTFGRHESFSLRYGWLTKGFNALKNGETFGDDATVTLGVGRNMVNAIKYWLKACQITDEQGKEFTPIGEAIFDVDTGFDPFLEDEATIWLLHWLLTTNPTHATAIYWFFNKFHKREFTSEEVQTALADFSKEYLDGKTSLSTIKGDAQLVLKMYSVKNVIKQKDPIEDLLDSPLSLLKLVNCGVNDKAFYSKPERRSQLPLNILAYAVTEYMLQCNKVEIPLEDLMYAKDDHVAPGAIFRLTESDLMTKLERIVNLKPNILRINETAGMSQLYLNTKDLDPMDYLRDHYKEYTKGAAA